MDILPSVLRGIHCVLSFFPARTIAAARAQYLLSLEIERGICSKYKD